MLCVLWEDGGAVGARRGWEARKRGEGGTRNKGWGGQGHPASQARNALMQRKMIAGWYADKYELAIGYGIAITV